MKKIACSFLILTVLVPPGLLAEDAPKPTIRKQTKFMQAMKFGEATGQKIKTRERFYTPNGVDLVAELEYSEFDGTLQRKLKATIDRVNSTYEEEALFCFQGKCELSERVFRKMDPTGRIYVDVRKYDQKGTLTYLETIRILDAEHREQIIYDRSGSITDKTSMEGPLGKVTRSRSFKPNGELRARCEYSYTVTGLPLETQCFPSYDRLNYKEEHKYDARGNEIETVTFTTGDSSLELRLSSRVVMEYDSEDRLVRLKSFSSLNEADKLYTYTYEYH